jgi:hypothetical protein
MNPLAFDPQRPVCSHIPNLVCPSSACPGRADRGICGHLDSLASWNRLTTEEQTRKLGHPKAQISPVVRDAVNACVWRGSVLPISLQDDCGCLGKELTECRAGRGTVAGRVTLRDCLNCQSR